MRFVGLLLLALPGLACVSSPAVPMVPIDPVVGQSCDMPTVASCGSSQRVCVEKSDGAHCAACADGTSVIDDACVPIDGAPLTHAFPEQKIEAGGESSGLCRSWTLHNDQEIWVTAVEYTQTEDSHHANYVFVPDDKYAGDDGIWICADRAYDLYQASAAGGVLYTQSTQTVHEVQRFPKGAAVRIPPHARIVSDIHLLNTGSDDVKGQATLTLFELQAAAVTAKLRAFHVEYDDLRVEPHGSARFTADCSVAKTVSDATKTPWAPKIYYLLPHTHSKATAFFADVLGGRNDGQALIDLPTFNGEAHGKAFSPPVDMTGADGFRFGCQYANPTNDVVGWGIGQNEMCELFGFAADSVLFQSRVAKGSSEGSDGTVSLFEGSCDTYVLDK